MTGKAMQFGLATKHLGCHAKVIGKAARDVLELAQFSPHNGGNEPPGNAGLL